MAKAKTKEPQDKHDQYELENAPYLIHPEKSCRIVRNYALLKGSKVDNGFILDYIECSSPEEAKRIRGWLWNAFAGGRIFAKGGK